MIVHIKENMLYMEPKKIATLVSSLGLSDAYMHQ